jgi:hypothetical protein
MVWGKDAQGKRFSYTYIEGQRRPNAKAGTNSDQPQIIGVGQSHRVPAGATVMVWGKDAQGKRFSYTYIEGQRRPSAVVPDTTAVCTLSIYNIQLVGSPPPGLFKWETLQICSGPFGEQKTESQMLRSSYRGYIGYGGIGTSALTPNAFDDLRWQEFCNQGKGKYNYQAWANGWSTGTGWGPHSVYTPNTIDQANCGGSPP